MNIDSLITERYARHISLPGIGMEGQRRLLASSALVVGLGGLGSPVASYLTAAGIGTIGLCDPDTVSVSNLQRQILYSDEDVGKPKTECALNHLRRMNPHTTFHTYPCRLDESEAARIIALYDIVLDCTDNFATRYIIDRVCRTANRPWVHGSIGQYRGLVTLFGGKADTRYTDLYPDSDKLSNQPAANGGVLGALAGVTGTIQATQAIQWLCGMYPALDGTLLCIDMLDMRFDKIQLR